MLLWLPRSTKRYSAFTLQAGANFHSIPAPAVHPTKVLDVWSVAPAPVGGKQAGHNQAEESAEAKAAEEASRAAEAKAAEDARRAAEAKAAEEARRAAELKAEDAPRIAKSKAPEKARNAAATRPGKRPEEMAAPPADLRPIKGIVAKPRTRAAPQK